jgi:uncharacterized surface protein with fasciclin (FAS1) repeats
MRRRHLCALVLALFAALALVPTAGAHSASWQPRHHHHGPKDIVQTARAAGDFHTLLWLVNKAGLTDTLESPGPFTVFAPTDEAFAMVPPATLHALANDPATLKKVLLYHVVSGAVSSSAAAQAGTATSVEGEPLTFTKTPGGLQVDGANVTTADVQASNGVIHVIDSVLTPPSLQPKSITQTAVASGQFTTLVKLLQATGLDKVLDAPGSYTVFAPTDAAFAKVPASTLSALAADPAMLKQVLLYHVLSGAQSTDQLAGEHSATTLEGQSVQLSRWCAPSLWWAWSFFRLPGNAPAPRCGALHVNDATVVAPDIQASNGVIDAIDTVLIPPTPSS